MYIIFTCLLLILIVFFWDTIKIMLKTMSDGDLKNGYLWFFSLLGINLIIIIFIIWFYYYKMAHEGKPGPAGIAGFPGITGEPCTFDTPCYSNKNMKNI